MNKPLISVIVPVYNGKLYLRKCIDSIINQTYRYLEIILVNDGSTDNSGQICDEYANNDERVIVIHKENEGQPTARNVGMNICKGKFVAFVDDDDYVDEYYIEYLYLLIVKYNASASMGRHNFITNGKTKPYIRKLDFGGKDGNDETILCSSRDIISDILYFRCSAAVWTNLYRQDDIKNMTFNKNARSIDDLMFYYDFSKDDKPIVLGSKCIYNHLIHSQSMTHTNSETMAYKKFDAIKEFKKVLIEAENTELHLALTSRYISICFHLLMKINKKSSKAIYDYLKNEIINNRKIVIMDRKVRIKTKVACFLSYFGFGITGLIFRMYSLK